MLADGGDALCDLRTLRDQGALFGRVASDATANQAVVVCTPEWVTADRVLAALDDLQGTGAAERLTLVLNQAPASEAVDRQVLEAAFRRHRVARRVAIPYDPLLRRMLDAGAYRPDQLPRPTRLAVLELIAAVAQELR